jgi:uncharacterized protein
METPVLLLPGIGNSGPQHWQSLWEMEFPHFQRIQQRDWDHPVCAEWVATLETRIATMTRPPILVAHSLACLMVAAWASSTRQHIKGALLVAVPDPFGPQFPAEASGFTDIPQDRFPFPSTVIASSNDPYATLAYGQQCADAWGSQFINIGDAGHINAASQLGRWEQGSQFLVELTRATT